MADFVRKKPSDDPMYGYDNTHHQSPDSNYVPGFGASKKQPNAKPASAKRDTLSNYWHVYAKNHSAQPYTEYHKAHNANIFNHVKEHYGVEVAKAMHGHAEALRQGGIYSIRKKYNIMEQNKSNDLPNKDKPATTKELARKYISKFRDQQVRNRKRLRKVSDVCAKEKLQESALNASGEQKFNELKEHPFVKNSFSAWHNPSSYGENHHSFQTKLHTFPTNGSTHELRASVEPNGRHAVTLLSNHKNKLDSIQGSGVGNNFHEAITNARANHFKAMNNLKVVHPKLAKGLTGMNNQFD